MNFFKSILSDDPEPENMDSENSDADRRPNQSPQHQEIARDEEEYANSNSTSSGASGGGLWSFGDLVKTLTTRSESVLETYRRDLKEFGSGLRKESDLFREVASRAVKELPTSIEVGASAIDGVLKSTADMISQGKDALLEPSDVDDSDASESVQYYSDRSRGYSRFDSQLNAIQTDARTYCEDPEDLDDYNSWKLGFLVGDKESEIEKLIGENGSMEAIYRKLVPNEVDDGSFWSRYFYRVHKLKQHENVRANLVRRSLTADDEEELSWDIDDDEPEEEADQVKPVPTETETKTETESNQSSNHESKPPNSNIADDDLENKNKTNAVNKNTTEEPGSSGGDYSDQKTKSVPRSDEALDDPEKKNANVAIVDKKSDESNPKTDENLGHSVNAGKEDDVGEEDIEWDEIEDLGETDEKRVSEGDSRKKGGLFKQMNANAGEEDEDLSWDIEDDDEPVKASGSK